MILTSRSLQGEAWRNIRLHDQVEGEPRPGCARILDQHPGVQVRGGGVRASEEEKEGERF